MTPFPLGCCLCKSDQAALLSNSFEVYDASRMNNLLNQTLSLAAGPISLTRKRALSSINIARDKESQDKRDFMKRQLAVKALQAKLGKQTHIAKKPAVVVEEKDSDYSSMVVLDATVATGASSSS